MTYLVVKMATTQKAENIPLSVFIQFSHVGVCRIDKTECLSSFKTVYKQVKMFCRNNPHRGSVPVRRSTGTSAIPTLGLVWEMLHCNAASGEKISLSVLCHHSGVTDLVHLSD